MQISHTFETMTERFTHPAAMTKADFFGKYSEYIVSLSI